jgi:hypothetical protein
MSNVNTKSDRIAVSPEKCLSCLSEISPKTRLEKKNYLQGKYQQNTNKIPKYQIPKYQNTKYKNTKIPKYQNTKYQNTKIPNTKIPKNQNTKYKNTKIPNTKIPKYQNTKYQNTKIPNTKIPKYQNTNKILIPRTEASRFIRNVNGEDNFKTPGAYAYNKFREGRR